MYIYIYLHIYIYTYECFHKWEVPKNGWFISGKIQMKMDDDWGYPHDETETPKVIDISWES